VQLVFTFFEHFLDMFRELAPYLLLGFFFAGLLHAFIPKSLIQKHLGTASKSSSLKAALFGVPLPLCSCGVLPMGVSLRKHGASKGATSSFLISTPQTGIDSAMVTWAFLGPVFAIYRVIVAFISGVLGGMIISQTEKKSAFDGRSATSANESPEGKKPLKQKTASVFSYGFIHFPDGIVTWLMIGISAAALITAFVPQELFSQFTDNRILSMLVCLVIGIPFYTCSTGSVPIAAALLVKGLTPGAAFTFLVAGPATSIASITVLASVLGKRTTLLYLLIIAVSAFGFGFLLDAVWAGQIESFVESQHQHGAHTWRWWEIAAGATLAAIVLYLYLRRLWRVVRYFFAQKSNTTTFEVEGMSCQKCAGRIADAISNTDSRASTQVDLKRKQVRVRGAQASETAMQQAIEKAGYKVVGH